MTSPVLSVSHYVNCDKYDIPITDRTNNVPISSLCSFEGWFAQRADIVLVFFDPDKPGTTGETMSVLLNSLSGMDHKLLIVLNKADQFEKIHDFARAYGSCKLFHIDVVT